MLIYGVKAGLECLKGALVVPCRNIMAKKRLCNVTKNNPGVLTIEAESCVIYYTARALSTIWKQ